MKLLLSLLLRGPAIYARSVGFDLWDLYERHRTGCSWSSRFVRFLVVSQSRHAFWLSRNAHERMDASLRLFEAGRRAFHIARYEFATKYSSGKDVADIASGTGYGTEILTRAGGARSAIGVDIDAEAVRYARAMHGPPQVQYRCASGDSTGLADGCVDLITSFETVEHVPSDRELMIEFDRLLRPGGMLLISTPNQWPCQNHPTHVREYNRNSFEMLLRRHFRIEGMWNQNSGTSSTFNRNQGAGIVPTTQRNQEWAECYLALCCKE
jgi:2-polyprenyl-3-methyl-5-hydroxy-6-metoxy-1,4-benzoquinol methylase